MFSFSLEFCHSGDLSLRTCPTRLAEFGRDILFSTFLLPVIIMPLCYIGQQQDLSSAAYLVMRDKLAFTQYFISSSLE